MEFLADAGVDPADDDDGGGGDGKDDLDCPFCACGVVLSHGPITFCEFPRYGKILAIGVLVLVCTDSADDVADSGDEFTVGSFCSFIDSGGEGSSLGSTCDRLDFGISLSWGIATLSSCLFFGGDDDGDDDDDLWLGLVRRF